MNGIKPHSRVRYCLLDRNGFVKTYRRYKFSANKPRFILKKNKEEIKVPISVKAKQPRIPEPKRGIYSPWYKTFRNNIQFKREEEPFLADNIGHLLETRKFMEPRTAEPRNAVTEMLESRLLENDVLVDEEEKVNQVPQLTRTVAIPENITLKELAARSELNSQQLLIALTKYFDLHKIDLQENSGISKTPGEKLSSFILSKIIRDAQSGSLRLNTTHEDQVLSAITLDYETAELLCYEIDPDFIKVIPVSVSKDEEITKYNLNEGLPRSPIVAVMGHVDHGKTTLLDTLRNATVAEKEAGGITQSVAAFRVNIEDLSKNVSEITLADDSDSVVFLDTPGHEAFTSMRQCGALITDIALIVVSAVDGLRPQTIESIKMALESKVTLMFAVTKIDQVLSPEELKDPSKSDALQQVLEDISTDLSTLGVETDLFGGETKIIPISAPQRVGLGNLLSALTSCANEKQLRAPVDVRGEGIVLESSSDKYLGNVVDVIVRNGTFSPGDIVVVNEQYSKIRRIVNPLDKDQSKSLKGSIKMAKPSDPIRLIGLNFSVQSASDIICVPSIQKAKEVTRLRLAKKSEQQSTEQKISDESQQKILKSLEKDELEAEKLQKDLNYATATLDSFANFDFSEIPPLQIPLVIKADCDGSVKGMLFALDKLTKQINEKSVKHLENLNRVKKKLLNIRTDSAMDFELLNEVRSFRPCLPLESGFKLIKSEVGAITEDDLRLLNTFDDISILGFNVAKPTKKLAFDERIFCGNVIYTVLDKAESLLLDHLPKVSEEVILGRATVVQVFQMNTKKKSGWNVGGCRVTSGVIGKNNFIRVIREGKVVYESTGPNSIDGLNHFKEAVTSVKAEQDCGISISGFIDLREKDVIEAFKFT